MDLEIFLTPISLRQHLPLICLIFGILCLGACGTQQPEMVNSSAVPAAQPSATPPSAVADVRTVSVSGEPNAYRFSVEIQSPDLGCEQYADWWEVLSVEGELLYRRILAHSHVNEQPFVRSGGPVPIAPDTVVWVRAHMHPGGYGGVAFKGSVEGGFQAADYAPDFALDAAETPPLPEGCAF